MNSIETHIAVAQKQPIRLQEYGINIFLHISTKSALKKALKKNLITVDGKIATTATFIKGGEVIELYKPVIAPNKRAFILDLEVIFEDDYLAVINKPAGILVSGNTFKTIANALSQNIKKSSQLDVVVPQPVHRLDYPTTGLLVVGKTSSSIVALNKLFKEKEITKTYYAVTIGKMEKEGSIKTLIDGKESLSLFEVVESVISERFQFLNLVKLYPKTGRKHQLRKHLAEIGNPILGDVAYGKDDLILKGKGLYLHAYSLEFIHPFTQETVCFKKELSNKYRKLFPEKMF